MRRVPCQVQFPPGWLSRQRIAPPYKLLVDLEARMYACSPISAHRLPGGDVREEGRVARALLSPRRRDLWA